MMVQEGAISAAGQSDAMDAALAEMEAAVTQPRGRRAKASGARAAAAPNGCESSTIGSATVSTSADAPVDMPRGFAMNEGGCFYTGFAQPDGSMPIPVWLSGHFDPLARVRDESGSRWSLLIVFRDPDQITKQHVLPYANFSGDGGGLLPGLQADGLNISPRRRDRERLIELFAGLEPPLRARRQDHNGLTADKRSFVLNETTFGVSDEVHLLDPAARNPSIGARGSLAEWQRTIAECVGPHDLLTFALAMSFTGVLTAFVNGEAVGIHFVGPSSTGKTTLALVAASPWGGPGFLRSWLSTTTALESTAAMFTDLPLVLDELHLIAPAAASIAFYQLSGGTGKHRARSDGEARPVKNWRTTVLSTGEIGLAAKVEEDGRGRLQSGQQVRIPEIVLDPTLPGGVCDACGSKEQSGRVVETIKSRLRQNYGHAGPRFLEQLMAAPDLQIDRARAEIRAFVADAVPPGADGQIGRVAQKFATVAASGELAVRLGVSPLEPGRTTIAARRLFDRWLGARGGAGSSEDRQAVLRVKDFILAHGSSRFQGMRADESWRTQMCAGYRDPDRNLWHFTDGAFKESLGGLDMRSAATALAAHGFLHREAGHLKCKVRTARGRLRLWSVRGSILEFDDERSVSDHETDDVDSEDL